MALSRFKIEYNGSVYELEAPSDATEEELLSAIESAPAANRPSFFARAASAVRGMFGGDSAPAERPVDIPMSTADMINVGVDASVPVTPRGQSVLDRPRPADMAPTQADLEFQSMSPEAQRRVAEQALARPPAPEPKRKGPSLAERAGAAVEKATGSSTLGQAARDVVDTTLLVPEMVATTGKLGADIANFATFGAADPLSQYLGRLIEGVQGDKSNRYQGLRRELAGLLQSEDAGLLDVLQFAARNPRYMTELGVPSVPSMLIGAGGARALGVINAAAASRAGGTIADILSAYRTGAAVGAGGSNVLMNAGATFSETDADLIDRLAAAGVAGAGTLVAGRLTGGGAEQALATGVRGGAVRRAAGVTARETGQEFVEGFSQAAGQGMGEGNFDLVSALKQAGVEAAAAAPLGAVAGLSAAREPGVDTAAVPRAPMMPDKGNTAQAPEQPAMPTPFERARKLEQDVELTKVENQPTTPVTPEQILAAPITPPAPPANQGEGAIDSRSTPAAPVANQTPANEPVDTTSPDAVLAALGLGGSPAARGVGPAGAAGGGQPGGGAGDAGVAGRGVQPGRLDTPAPVAQPGGADVAVAGGGARPAVANDYLRRVETARTSFAQAIAANPELRKHGVPEDVRPVSDMRLVEAFDAVASAIAGVSGAPKVTLVESSDSFDGVNWRGQLLVNTTGMQKPAVFVAAHETAHTLQNMAEAAERKGVQATPEEAEALRVWRPVEEALWGMIDEKGKRQYVETFLELKGDDGKVMTYEQVMADPESARTARREILADFHARRMTDPETVNELARREPKAFGDYAKKVIGFLNNAIAALRGKKSLGINDIDKMIADLKKAKAIWVDAMVGWQKRGGAQAAPQKPAATKSAAKPRKVVPIEKVDDAIAQDELTDEDYIEEPGLRYSRRGPSTWRDAAGRLRFAPTAIAYDKLAPVANAIMAKLGINYMPPLLKRQVRAMKQALEQSKQVAQKVAIESFNMTEADRQMVSDIIEGELKAGTVPPAHAVRMAAGIQQIMDQQTNELVRLGMMTQETADRWRGKYLPRFYASKLRQAVQDPWNAAVQSLNMRPGLMMGIKAKSMKGRGLWETVPVGELQDWRDQGWEVRDQDYDPAASTEVQVWRDFTREEREKMGEIRDAGFRFVQGFLSTQRDIALGRMFEGIASNKELASKNEKPGWVQVPDGTVPGTGVKRYGKLAGMWVPQDVITHLKNHDDGGNEALRLYRQALAAWKEGKTVLNPVAHANNVMSNVTMAHFAGVSYWDAHKYAGAIMDLSKNRPMVEEARNAGLFLGTMTQEELLSTMPKELRAMAAIQESKVERAAGSMWNMMSLWLRRPAAAMYQAEDLFFRYVIYRDARARGLSPEEAVDYSQRYIFTYDDLPKVMRTVRDFGLPFVSYTYKVIPALLHTATYYPHRMLAPASLMYGLSTLMYALAAGEEGEELEEKVMRYLEDPARRKKAADLQEREAELLPPWMRGYTALGTPKAVRLGMDEVTGLPLFWDVSRVIPGGDIFDVEANSEGVPWPQPLMPSHPIWSTFSAMFVNKDMFFGKKIVDSNDTVGEAFEKRAGWLWKQFTPAVAYGNYHSERLANVVAQMTGGPVTWRPAFMGAPDATGFGRDGLPVDPARAAMQTVGIKVRPIDLELSAQIEASQRRRMIRDIDNELRSLRRLNERGALSDRLLEQAYERALVKKDRLREGLTVDGEAK